MNDNIEWVVVPREPTEAMWNAGKHFCDGHVTRTIQAYAAMLAAAPKPEAQAAGDEGDQSPEDLATWLDRKYARHGEDEDRQAAAMLRRYAALSTPASHDAQQDTSPEYRRGWLAGVESMRQELTQQPAVVGDAVDEAEVDAVYQRLRDVGLRILTRDQVRAAFKEQADHDAALTPRSDAGRGSGFGV